MYAKRRELYTWLKRMTMAIRPYFSSSCKNVPIVRMHRLASQRKYIQNTCLNQKQNEKTTTAILVRMFLKERLKILTSVSVCSFVLYVWGQKDFKPASKMTELFRK